MSSINQITAIIVESLLNSPYKGYYKKEYLSVLKTLNSIYQARLTSKYFKRQQGWINYLDLPITNQPILI